MEHNEESAMTKGKRRSPKTETARKGGMATKHRYGVTMCPNCHQLMPSGYYSGMGAKGAEAAHSRYSSEQYGAWGRMGGRGRKKQKGIVNQRKRNASHVDFGQFW